MNTVTTVTVIIPLQALVCCLSNPIGDGRANCSSAARTDLLRRRTHGRHGSPDSDETAPRPTTPVQESDLALWRAKALERMPYFAPILFSLRVLDAPGLGTFAVDAWHRLYVDFDAVAGWSAMENAEALLHECGHLFRDHAARADTSGVRDGEHTAWNIAADAMLNLDLVQAGCRTLGQKGILPAKLGLPDGRTTEWYFDQLRPKLG